jgi:TetR/AcrR family transcriptional regulator, mexJK operon transcriptional repressor
VLDRFLAAMTAVVDEVALGESDDLARDLGRLGAGWVALALQPEMAGLRRLIVGEAAAFPNLAAEWRERGPNRAQAMLRREFEHLAGRGRIDVPGPLRHTLSATFSAPRIRKAAHSETRPERGHEADPSDKKIKFFISNGP